MWKLDQLLGVIAPFECLNCGREGDVICATCLCSLPQLLGRCYRCYQSTIGVICGSCQAKTRLSQVWVVSNYADHTADLIAALKFDRAQAAARLIALAMHQVVPRLAPDTIVTHIPTANARVRQRGYDQARLIARAFANYRQLPYASMLLRYGHSRQLGAGRMQRLLQLQSSLACSHPSKVRGQNILMVDDVLTTGATVETAAKVLAQYSVSSVSAVLFAQKI